jgi:hypothetical protein
MNLARLLLYLILSSTLAVGQELIHSSSTGGYPYSEAQTVLGKSCQAVALQFDVPTPTPRVQLSLGHRKQSIISQNGVHTINIRQWNMNLFQTATLAVCLRAAEPVLVQKASVQIAGSGSTSVLREGARDQSGHSRTTSEITRTPDDH